MERRGVYSENEVRNMIKCLVTAIGSMSADCVISNLKNNDVFVAGCDIYPGEWHSTTSKCDRFYKAPLVSQESEYLTFISEICEQEKIDFIFPLTDIEVDFFNIHRAFFENKGVRICISSSETLNYARDKYNLYLLFENDADVPSVRTWTSDGEFIYPCIAKPKNGRSSEGLMRLESSAQLANKETWDNYIFQEIIDGDIYTVDLLRSEKENKEVCVSRIELLRTKNGAGTTVMMQQDDSLNLLVRKIGQKLHITGCVNMEFIKCNNLFYLIDINPRFSAGVAFSHLAGYNMVLNHLKVFMDEPIEDQILYADQIFTKKYVEEILK